MYPLEAVIIKLISKRALTGSSVAAGKSEVKSKQEFEAEAKLPATRVERAAL